MPELPEVETAVRGVSPYLKDYVIEKENFVEKFILKQALRKTEGTDIEKLLKNYHII